jgi:hypothetical protein
MIGMSRYGSRRGREARGRGREARGRGREARGREVEEEVEARLLGLFA